MVRSRILWIVLALAGCDRVFGLTAEIPPDALTIDRCGPTAYDPLRYAAIASPSTTWGWSDARTACQLRGMDLAVINDVHELGSADAELRPYWVGEQELAGTWSTVDGCPAFDAPAPAQALAPPNQCGMVDGTLAIAGASCDGSGAVVSALCETPRTDSPACRPTHPGEETYVLSPAPLAYADAQAFCTAQHAHLAVIDTSAEWLHLAALARSGGFPSFWLGARMAAGAWTTESGCPGLYAWTAGAPVITAATACASGTMLQADGGTRLDGVSAASCETDRFVALCELE